MITILLPVYNREKYIIDTLKSLERQTYKNFKVLIYDDGSTDNTYNSIIDYADKSNMVIDVLKSYVNCGVGFARNKLLEDCDTQYAIWQDSDDIAHPNRVETLYKEIKSQKCNMLFSAMYFFNDGNSFTQTKTVNRLDISKYTSREGLLNNMNFATAIFETNLKRYTFKDVQAREDVEWLSRLIREGIKFGYIDTPLYYCRRHEGRLTYQYNKLNK